MRLPQVNSASFSFDFCVVFSLSLSLSLSRSGLFPLINFYWEKEKREEGKG